MKCNDCGKEFTVETEGRNFVFCPYCGTKHILGVDKYKTLKELLHAAKKDPKKNWELAEELYNIVIIKRKNNINYRVFAKSIGMSQSSLSSYIAAYKFAKEEKIDKSKMGFTKAARLGWCKDLYLVKLVLHDAYGKDIYTATLKEIKEVVSDVNSTAI